jgi:uncharacterized protein YndB with AHSA1/START domain
MFKKIIVGLLLIIAILAVVIALQPSEYQITRSITIKAPPETVFPLVNDFQQWAKWSPWDKKDAAMKRTFEGSPTGAGSIYRWNGNDDVGTGSMTITESKPAELVSIKLEFKKPMESEAMSAFTFQPQDQTTLVTWKMSGTNNFVGKAFSLMMNMDKMIGGDFEKGLTSMKELAESPAKQ